MASVTIAEFLASVGFKADENSLKSALTKVAGFGAAVSVAAGAAIAGIMRVAESEVALAKKAEQLQMPIAKLEELGYVAEQTGASADTIAQALGSLKSKYPHVKDASALLERMGERMRGMNEQAARLYAQRMGIDPTLVPMLTRDVSALKDEIAAMYSVAGRDAQQSAADSKAFLAELGKLRTMSELLAKSIGGVFLGQLRGDVEHLRRVIMENFGKIKAIFASVIAIVLRIAGVVGAFVRRVVTWASALVSWYDKLDDGQKRLVQGVLLFLAAWKLLNAGFLATPLGVIVAGLAAIIALIDDYQTYMEGGEAYFDWGPWAATIDAVVSSLGACLSAVGTFISNNQMLFSTIAKGLGIFMAVKAALMAVVGVLQGLTLVFRVLWGIVAANPLGMLITIVAVIIAKWDTLKAYFGQFWDWVSTKFPDFAAWAERSVAAVKQIFAPLWDWISSKLEAVTGWLPDWARDAIGMGKKAGETTRPALTPQPVAAAAAAQGPREMRVESKTEITVNGTTSPEQVAGMVAQAQNHSAADMARNVQGAVR